MIPNPVTTLFKGFLIIYLTKNCSLSIMAIYMRKELFLKLANACVNRRGCQWAGLEIVPDQSHKQACGLRPGPKQAEAQIFIKQ